MAALWGKKYITPDDFNFVNHETPINISRLLTGLDIDNNPLNGIKIDPDILKKMPQMMETADSLYFGRSCFQFSWGETLYRVSYIDMENAPICPAEPLEIPHFVVIKNTLITTDLIGLDKERFENHPGLTYLFLSRLEFSGEKRTPKFHEDSEGVLNGYFSGLWGLPENYWKYERRFAEKLLEKANAAPYFGNYSGTYTGSDLSGILNFQIKMETTGVKIRSINTGSSCNGSPTEIYGSVSNLKTGEIKFSLQGCKLSFIGTINPESGAISGTVTTQMGEYAGTFSCQRQLSLKG